MRMRLLRGVRLGLVLGYIMSEMGYPHVPTRRRGFAFGMKGLGLYYIKSEMVWGVLMFQPAEGDLLLE